MALSLSVAWKLALAVALGTAIFASACARAPRQTVPRVELRRLVLCALILYLVGALAILNHHAALAGLVYGAGIMVSALAAWLSRGHDRGDPPDGPESIDEPPPPEPDGVPGLDWPAFEHDFREYAERVRSICPGPGAPRPGSGAFCDQARRPEAVVANALARRGDPTHLSARGVLLRKFHFGPSVGGTPASARDPAVPGTDSLRRDHVRANYEH